MKIGIRISNMVDIAAKIEKVASLGIHSCQLNSFDTACYTDENVRIVLEACEKYDVTISTFWAGWSGPRVWNFTEGPTTLGLLPEQYRATRVADLKAGADFAKKLGVTQIATHAGFIPEDPNDPQFYPMMDAIREVAQHCKDLGLKFLFETGQETSIALLRAIETVGTGNLGLNLDTANPILYGKANPVDMMEILGDYVCDLHIKDGMWPTDGWHLGKETPVGQGKVDFAKIIRMLKDRGYDGALTIEREISGDEQICDILSAKAMLEKLLEEA